VEPGSVVLPSVERVLGYRESSFVLMGEPFHEVT
jgi:hypothetical protein